MELCYDIMNNEKADKIVSIYKKITKSAATDIISALNIMAQTIGDADAVNERIEITYVMCFQNAVVR